mgnify:CR=1 FL=1
MNFCVKRRFVEKLKNPNKYGKDYFDELLERIREIRASERRAYQKITDVFEQCSYDYDKNIVFKQLKEKLLTLYITITLKDSKRSLQIPIQDIYSVISIGHDLVVHTPKEDYMTTGTLKDFCNDYINTTLVQIQKNMIINLQYVEDYNRNIILYNNENLTVGRIYKNNFLHHYKEYKKL